MIHLLLEYLGNVSMSLLQKKNKITEMTGLSVKGHYENGNLLSSNNKSQPTLGSKLSIEIWHDKKIV